jgi:hypothetical protein
MEDKAAARYLNMALGAWVLISAFVWPHNRFQFVVTSVVGAVVLALAPFSGELPRLARTVNVIAGLALAAAALRLPRSAAFTAWHNAIFGLAIAAVALGQWLPETTPEPRTPRRRLDYMRRPAKVRLRSYFTPRKK